MIWSANNVAEFVRSVGFDPDVIGDAVALVLASSGGDDAWRYVAGIGGRVDQRGLFALDVKEWSQVADHDLFSPLDACAAAYGIAAVRGGQLDWHPSYGTRQWSAQLGTARAAAREAYRPDPVADMAARAATVGVAKAARGAGRDLARTITELGAALRHAH